MMTLKEYLSLHQISQTDFSGSLGVSKGYLSDLLRGRKLPSLTIAVKIQDLTKGAVMAGSWVSPKNGEAA
ncbi:MULTISPECIES: helix-turn-helix domain-containing protein [Thioclava]|uniref:helix-turn-helix domain-containing protein n=1 Tax=Thioclava TaxID=285107 RepID=UPI0033270872